MLSEEVPYSIWGMSFHFFRCFKHAITVFFSDVYPATRNQPRELQLTTPRKLAVPSVAVPRPLQPNSCLTSRHFQHHRCAIATVEPVTIVTMALSVGKVIAQLAVTLYAFVQSTREVDTTLGSLLAQ
jgi:hypothetical protein